MIITYNSEGVIEACLRSLAEMAPSLAVTVFDNASTDRTIERVHGVQVTRSEKNLGFASAINQGFRESAEDTILILNPDVAISTSLEPLLAACTEHGAAAGLLTDADGAPQQGFAARALPTTTTLVFEVLGLNRIWAGNPVNRRYRQLDRDLTQPGFVEQPPGAFFALRRDIWETIGGWDQSFFPVWYEDVDYCQRLAQAGVRIAWVPEVRARHMGGHSVRQMAASRRTSAWYGSLLRYAAKHCPSMGYRMVCLATLAGVFSRMIVATVRDRSLSEVTSHLEVLKLAGGRLVASGTGRDRSSTR